MIHKHKKLYGFDLIDKLKTMGLQVKEGTLYPLLNRMTRDHILESYWKIEGDKGHPRKFYRLSEQGHSSFSLMKQEFRSLVDALENI